MEESFLNAMKLSFSDVSWENPPAPDLSALYIDACRMIDDYESIWQG